MDDEDRGCLLVHNRTLVSLLPHKTSTAVIEIPLCVVDLCVCLVVSFGKQSDITVAVGGFVRHDDLGLPVLFSVRFAERISIPSVGEWCFNLLSQIHIHKTRTDANGVSQMLLKSRIDNITQFI